MNISFLGYSGSGKTCYLYAAFSLLSKGIKIDDHLISVTCQDRQGQLRLYEGALKLSNNKWPLGSDLTIKYPFNLRIDGKSIDQFTLYDYKGGLLNGIADPDVKGANEIFDTIKDSNCIVFFVDGDTVLKALNPKDVSPEHQIEGSIEELPIIRMEAEQKINFIEFLLQECNKRLDNKNVPILLTITKRDIFTDNELQAGYQLLQELLPSLFALRNDKKVGMTSVTLGKNLKKVGPSEMEGQVRFSTDNNIHIPLLFALLQGIGRYENCFDNAEEARRLIWNIFKDDKISFYRGGKPAVLI